MTQIASSLDDEIEVIKLDAMFLCAGNALLEKSACDAKGVSHSPYVPTYYCIHARGGIESNQRFRCQMGGNANAGYIARSASED